MDKVTALVDRILTFCLQALVVGMVLCVTAEIVLNAFIQPAAVWVIRRSGGEQEADATIDAASRPLLARTLAGMTTRIGRISAPINVASQTLLVWIGILGSALAFRARAHLGVDALVRVYPPRVRLALDYASTALVGLFSLIILLVGGVLVTQTAFSRGYLMPGMEFLNRGWFYLCLPLAGALNLFYCVHHLRHPKPVGEDEISGPETTP